jgi:hypothetical protein
MFKTGRSTAANGAGANSARNILAEALHKELIDEKTGNRSGIT